MAPTIAVIFGLVAGIGWGTGPIASKHAYKNGGSPLAACVTQTAIGVGVLWVITLGVYGPQTITQFSLPSIAPFIVTGIVASAIGRFLLYHGIDLIGASVNSSLAATDPFFATIIAFSFLNETPTGVEIVGCVLTVVGVAAVAGSNGGNKTAWQTRLVIIPLFAASLYGVGAAIRRFGLETSQVPPLVAATVNETAAILLWAGVFTIGRIDIRSKTEFESYRYLLLTGLLYSTGTVSMFAALNAGPVIIGTTLGSTAGVISVLGSQVWLSEVESVTKMVVVGSVITVVGVILLSL